MRLSQAPAGRSLVVVRVDGDDPLARRLYSLGFQPGTAVDRLHRAPFGGAAAYRVLGHRVALRDDEANRVVVGDA